MISKLFSCFAAAVLFFNLASAAEFARIQNLQIVLPDNASGIEKFAAQELKTQLEKVYTQPVKLNGKVPKEITLKIGNPAMPLKPGRFAVLLQNNTFTLWGFDSPQADIRNYRTDCGTFHAAAYFLQRYVGVRYYLPSEKGIFHPQNPELTFNRTLDLPEPSFELRKFFQTANKGVKPADLMLFFQRRLGRYPEYGRSDYHYVFWKRWAKVIGKRKELLPLHEGERVNSGYPMHFPCLSNPDTLKLAAEDIRAILAKRPAIRSIRFYTDAPAILCECSECAKTLAASAVVGNDHSEMMYGFFARLGNELHKTHPYLRFRIQTKGNAYSQPPQGEVIPYNTEVSILTGQFEEPDFNAIRQLINRWRNAGAAITTYAYARPPALKAYPIINPRRIAKYFRELQGYSLGSMFAEGRRTVPYSMSALNNYVQSAVLFDANADVDKLIKEFCTLISPKAADELYKFHDQMEKLITRSPFWADPAFNVYSPKNIRGPKTALQRALALDKDNEFIKTLAADFASFEQSMGFVQNAIDQHQKLMKKYSRNVEILKDLQLVNNAPAVKLPLIPFMIYPDYQEANVEMKAADGNLILSFECNENAMKKLKVATSENFKGQIWNDDVVEIFFAAPDKKLPYIHLAVNANGFYRPRLHRENGSVADLKTLPIKTAVKHSKDKWHLTITLPLSSLKDFMPAGSVQMGIFRSAPIQRQHSGLMKPENNSFHSPTGRFTVKIK